VNTPLQDLDDNQLALLAASGRREAFERLYDRHCRGVAKVLAPFAGGDRDAVDDLAQEVFIQVVKGLRSYRAVAPFANWLYTIALNTGRNHARASNRLRLAAPEELETIPAGAGETPALSEELVRRAALKAAARLPEHLRDILALRISSDLSYARIGVVAGVPEGTARRRMHEALNRLRATLGLTEEKEVLEHEPED